MNDNFDSLKTAMGELGQVFVSCLKNMDEKLSNKINQDQLNTLLEKLETIIKQNDEIIAQNKTLVGKLNNLTIYTEQPNTKQEQQKLTTEEATIEQTKEEDAITIAQAEQAKEVRPTVERKQNYEMSLEEQIEQTQREIEEMQAKERMTPANEEKDSSLEIEREVENKTENEKTQEEEKPRASSPLEFLHTRVMKDGLKNDDKTDNQPLPSAKEIINQVKQAVNNQSESKEVSEPKQVDVATTSAETSKKQEEHHEVKEQGDLFAHNKPKSIADMFENRNKRDLRTAVGVSEKFMFINDLFSGNIREYTEFINQLNTASSLQDSLEIIKAKQEKKHWAKGSIAYVTLERLVTKRFEQTK